MCKRIAAGLWRQLADAPGAGERSALRSIFTCTSPWEIYGYGLQKKVISPFLEKFFYARGYDARATTAIMVDEVLSAVMNQLSAATPAAEAMARQGN